MYRPMRAMFPTEPIPLNCPKCPRKMQFVKSENDVHVYACPVHGEWHLGQGGLLPAEDRNSSVSSASEPR